MTTLEEGRLRYTLRQLCGGDLSRNQADPELCKILEQRGLARADIGRNLVAD